MFSLTYHFAVTISYFSLPSKTNKQKCHLLIKYHPFFTLIYCPLAPSPLVPGQVIRLPGLPRQGRVAATAAPEACWGPCHVSPVCQLPSVRLALLEGGRGAARSPHERVERQGLSRDRLTGNSRWVFGRVDQGLSQETTTTKTGLPSSLPRTPIPRSWNHFLAVCVSLSCTRARHDRQRESPRTARPQTHPYAFWILQEKHIVQGSGGLASCGLKSVLPPPALPPRSYRISLSISFLPCKMPVGVKINPLAAASTPFLHLLQGAVLPGLSKDGLKTSNALYAVKRMFKSKSLSWPRDKFSKRKLL